MKTNRQISRYSTYLRKVAGAYQQKEVKIYFNLILTLLTISFFAFFAIKPTLATIAELVKKIKDQKTVHLKLEKKLDDLVKAKKQYSTIEPNLELLEEAVPPQADVAHFLGQIEVLAQENNLNINSAKTEDSTLKGKQLAEKKEKSLWPTVKNELSLTGNYKDFKNFLRALIALRRLTNIRRINMLSGQESTSEPLGLGLDLEIYYLPTDKK